MKTAFVADLRNEFPRLERWLKQGEVIQITKRGQHLATPAQQSESPETPLPDYRARLQLI
ncbi:MAG: prevent-host-death protein [Chthoniobacteraceae bacterium]